MGRRSTHLYEVVYYDDSNMPPAYYLIGGAEGESLDRALQLNLHRLIAPARELLRLQPEDLADEKIQRALYVIRSDDLVSSQSLSM